MNDPRAPWEKAWDRKGAAAAKEFDQGDSPTELLASLGYTAEKSYLEGAIYIMDKAGMQVARIAASDLSVCTTRGEMTALIKKTLNI